MTSAVGLSATTADGLFKCRSGDQINLTTDAEHGDPLWSATVTVTS